MHEIYELFRQKGEDDTTAPVNDSRQQKLDEKQFLKFEPRLF